MTVPSRAWLPWISLGVLLHQAGAVVQGGGGEDGSSFSYVFVEDTLRINCSVNTSVGWHATHLTFTRHNDFYDGFYSLPEDEVMVLSNSTVQLSHRVSGAQDGGQYRCWVKTAQNSSLVHTHQVYVQYHLQKVSNTHCEVKNWDESLTCRWDYGVKYVNNSDTDLPPSPVVSVMVNLMLPPHSISISCSQALSVYDGWSQCVWSGDQFRGASRYLLSVDLINRFTKQRNITYHMIDTNNIVKPSPVNNIEVQNVTSSCVSLVWNHTRIYRTMVYRINVTNGFSQLARRRGTELCGLLPYTSYSLSLQCRPLGSDGNQTGFWSDPLSITVHTAQSALALTLLLLLHMMAVPSSSFEVHTGGYLLGPCKDGTRNITILWKEVLPAERHGEIIGYQLIYNGTSLSVDVVSPTWGVVPTVPCDSHFPVRIFARTAVGASLSNAMLYINTGDPEPVAELGVALGERGVHVVWGNTSVGDDPQATVFWCPQHKASFDRTCKVRAEIQWINVSVSAGGVDIPQLSASGVEADAHDYLFGFSTPGQAIQWAQCYFRHEAPMTAPEVRVRAVDHQLDVEWTPQQCSDQYPIHTTMYRVHYCQQTLCPGGLKVIEVKGVERNFYSIRGQPGTKYNVSVESVDFFGRHSPLSAPQIEAIPGAQGSSLMWLWVTGPLFVLLFVILLVWCGCRLYGKLANHKAKFAPYYRPNSDMSCDEGQDQPTPGSSPTLLLFSNLQPNSDMSCDEGQDQPTPGSSPTLLLFSNLQMEGEDTSCNTMLTDAGGVEGWCAGGNCLPHNMDTCVVPQPHLQVFPVLLDTDTQVTPDLGPSIPLNVLDTDTSGPVWDDPHQSQKGSAVCVSPCGAHSSPVAGAKACGYVGRSDSWTPCPSAEHREETAGIQGLKRSYVARPDSSPGQEDSSPHLPSVTQSYVRRSDQSVTPKDQPCTMARQTGSSIEDTPYMPQQDSVGIVREWPANLSNTPTPSNNTPCVGTPLVPTAYVGTSPVPTAYVGTPPVPTAYVGTPPVPTAYVGTPPVPTAYVVRENMGEEDCAFSVRSQGSDEVDLMADTGQVFGPT